MSNKELCRLCGRENGILISIYESTSDCLAKIESVVPDVVILREDSLSKYVCHRCVAKIKEFHEFKETCIRTQQELKLRIPWMSLQNGKTFLHQRQASPIVTYLGGPLAHPFGDPEPVVEILTLSDDDESGESSTTSTQTRTNIATAHQEPKQTVFQSLPLGIPLTKPRQNGNGADSNALHSPIEPRIPSQSFTNYQYCRPMQGPQGPAPPSAPLGSQSVAGSLVRLPTHPHPYQSFLQRQLKISNPTSNQPLALRQPASQIPNVLSPVSKGPRAQTPFPSKQKGRKSLPPPRRNHAVSCSSTLSVTTPMLAVPNYCDSMQTNILPSCSPVINHEPSPLTYISISTLQNDSSLHPKELSISPTMKVINKNIAQLPGKNLLEGNKRKKRFRKPKPLSKKRPQDLSEEDRQRICSTYPKIQTLKICENTIIFICSGCNKILMTEEAISVHECAGVENADVKTDNNGELRNAGELTSTNLLSSEEQNDVPLNQNEDSNDSISSSVELICSDSEISDHKAEAKHQCTICGKQFLNLARLQKHVLFHASTEAH